MKLPERVYQIALTMVEGIGNNTIRKLVSVCGSASQVFRESKRALSGIEGIGTVRASLINLKPVLSGAEKEFQFIQSEEVSPIFISDKTYPSRLRMCNDAPVLLYSKGNMDLNVGKVVTVIGTRKATQEGLDQCARMISDLGSDVLVISGLAYGVDICAHRQAMKNEMQTIAVLGHGLDRLYPWAHRREARSMQEKGGLLTEFRSETNPDRENFPARNRIVAGLSDVTVVVESELSGGSMITARMAHSYNRDVAAFPGRPADRMSVGCNHLIKTNQAFLINDAKDLKYSMGWDLEDQKVGVQQSLFVDLDEEEELVVEQLRVSNNRTFDDLAIASGIPAHKLSGLLLNLEFKGMVLAKPGKVFSLK